MKPYTTVKQFEDRLAIIRKEHFDKLKGNRPKAKEILLFIKRVNICQRNLKRLKRLISFPEGSIMQLTELHRMLVGEIMQTSTVNGSWELRSLSRQLIAVTKAIQELQNAGRKLTFIQKVKVFLKRLKSGKFLTLFTNH